MDGQFVRFYLSDATMNATPVAPTLYNNKGEEVTIAEGQWFFIADMGWDVGANGAVQLFDDYADDQTISASNRCWHMPADTIDQHSFQKPLPVGVPMFYAEVDEACAVWGHGYVRLA